MNDETISASALNQGCPSRESWRLYQSGKLDMLSIETMSEHLAQCDQCLQIVDDLHHTPSLQTAARRSAVHAADHSTPAEFPSDPQKPGRPDDLRHTDYVRDKHFQRLQSRLETLEIEGVATQQIAEDQTQQPLFPPRLDRFEVRKVLGTGGFGEVFLAYDPRLDRLVAIKTVKLTQPNQIAARQALLQEARLAASLDDNGIVPIYELLPTDADRTLIVMKYIDGESLAARIKRARPDAMQSVRILERVARAVHVAHEQGLVHRDLKPANILLSKEGDPLVADFGLSFRLNDRPAYPTHTVAGSPPYMSPEQARGDLSSVDRRTDIWSLGVILVELIHGQRPYSQKPQDKLLEAIRTIDPEIISNGKTRELDLIARRCLNKSPDARFQSALEFADALQTWLERTKAKTQKSAQLRTRATLIAIATVVVVLISYSAVLIPNRRAEQRLLAEKLLTADSNELERLLPRLKQLQSPFGILAQLDRPNGLNEQFRHDLGLQYCGLMSPGEFCDLTERLDSNQLLLLLKHRGIKTELLLQELTQRIEAMPPRLAPSSTGVGLNGVNPTGAGSSGDSSTGSTARKSQDQRRARLAALLMFLGEPRYALNALSHDPDPTLQTLVIHELARMSIPAGNIVSLLDELADRHDLTSQGAKFGLLQTLALLPSQSLEPAQASTIVRIWQQDPDCGVHSSAQLAAQHHNISLPEQSPEANHPAHESQFANGAPSEHSSSSRSWFTETIAGRRQDFVIIEPSSYRIGTNDPGIPFDPLPLHDRVLPRRIAMGTTEITVEQFRRAGQPFDKQSDYLKQASDEAAMLSLKQQFAFAFCNAISEEHKLEPCYEWTTSQSGLILVPKANHVTLSGYRLPTECE